MYLSRLDLHGFKSFALRTALQFDPGTTAIVGPNGCGKSNIVDAVRWVIGEQRARVLRSNKMENVIFNGTAKRRPLGMAEVLLTIENTRGVLPIEYSEVTIGRRLYRSGESEYLLNGTACRLKDITDLFMDTGMGAGAYSVIELKMIEEILSDNAQDQRRLFEEAAGITKYKLRRRQTLGKLDTTQADLERLGDLVDEIDKQVRSLKRQADKASRYKRYREALHERELQLAQAEYARYQRQRQTVEAEVATLQQRVRDQTADLETAEERLADLHRALGRDEERLSKAQQQLNVRLDGLREAEAEVRLLEERREAAARERERLRREQAEEAERQQQRAEETERLADVQRDAVPALADARAEQDAARSRRDAALAARDAEREAVRETRAAARAAEQALTDGRRQLDRLASRRDVHQQERSRAQERLADLERQQVDVDRELRTAEADIATQEQALAATRDELQAAEDELNRLRTERDAAQAEYQEVAQRYHAAAAEVQVLDSVIHSYDVFSDAVQHLAAHTETWSDQTLRTVADVLQCPAELRPALEAALGDWAEAIVVPTDAAAHRAIARLRADEQGQATFLVLDRLPEVPATTPNGHRPLRPLVEAEDPSYEAVADVLLHQTYLVDDDTPPPVRADEVASLLTRYVTRDGAWADPRGGLHGGSANHQPTPLSERLTRRAQHEAAAAQLQRLDEQRTEAQARLAAAEASLAQLSVDALRTAVRDAEDRLSTTKVRAERLRTGAESYAQRLGELQERIAALTASIDAAAAEATTLEGEMADAEAEAARLRTMVEERDTALQEVEAAYQAAVQRFNEVNLDAVQLQNQLDNLERDLERLHAEQETTARRQDERATQLAARTAAIEEADAALLTLRREAEAQRAGMASFERAVQEAKTALMKTKVDIEDLESHLRSLRRSREQHMREENLLAVRLAEIGTRTETIVENMLETYEVDLRAETIPLPDDFEEGPARAEVQDLRSKIRNLGSVNELALETYEEERERLDFLLAQRDDLEQAEATLMETIDEINTTAADRFNTTFEAIRENFGRIFTELFGEGAVADLSLVDPSDPLESAMQIAARPKGKRPSTLQQLSGGEKTLTAIALLFAIYLVKPSPFCILDEVDAPLDDANVDRFMRLIQAFSDNTQFILVTHNKRTMEMADRLYGITMQEQGVSKLVGVQFDEAAELVG